MILEKVKTAASAREAIAMKVDGRDDVELVVKDKNVTGIRIGGLHISVQSYNLEIMAETPFHEASWWMGKASVKGFGDKVQYFPEYDKAREWLDEFDRLTVETDGPTSAKVLVDEKGEFVRASADPEPGNSSDIPF